MHGAFSGWSQGVMCFLLQPVLFAFCAGNELFFAMLYLVYFTPGPTSEHTLYTCACFNSDRTHQPHTHVRAHTHTHTHTHSVAMVTMRPFFKFSCPALHCVPFPCISPSVPLLLWSVGLWHLLLAISLPVALGKNIINGIQLVEAAQAIAAQDVKEREKETAR